MPLTLPFHTSELQWCSLLIAWWNLSNSQFLHTLGWLSSLLVWRSESVLLSKYILYKTSFLKSHIYIKKYIPCRGTVHDRFNHLTSIITCVCFDYWWSKQTIYLLDLGRRTLHYAAGHSNLSITLGYKPFMPVCYGGTNQHVISLASVSKLSEAALIHTHLVPVDATHP